MSDSPIKLGTELISFFNLGWWNLPEMPYEEWMATVLADPRPYFDRMLDAASNLGLDGIELAPTPGNWEGATAAYGSRDGVAEALGSRGLVLGSSYMDGSSLIQAALEDPETLSVAEASVERHANFVSGLGCQTIVMGTVSRVQFTSGDYAADVPSRASERVAAIVDRLGAAAAQHGVSIALHTDAYSVCSRNRDIDTIMRLTDPAAVGLCLDAGHTTLDGGDAVEALRSHVARTPVMHWKDCAAPLDGATLSGTPMQRHEVMLRSFRVLGAGSIDWSEWQRVLAGAHWRGWAMAEIDMSEDPVGEMRLGLDYFERELRPIYG